MKAAVYYKNGTPDVLKYEEVPDPAVRRGGLIIEVKAIGVQGGDTLNRLNGVLPSVPHIVGYQAAGVVREVGEGVTQFTAGQPVVATMGAGSHAELVSVSARAVYSIPSGLSVEAAAAIPIEFGTADDCLFEFGHLCAGEKVLIHAGASGVGIAAIQLAKRAGATVLATASSEERLTRLREFGLDYGVNYARDDWSQIVRDLTEGKGPDLIVDSVGGHVLQRSLETAAYRGRVVTIGQAGRDGTKQDTWPLVAKNATLGGVLLAAEMAANGPRTRAVIERLLSEVAHGNIRTVIDRKFSLSEAAAAHEYIESRRAFGRVLLIP